MLPPTGGGSGWADLQTLRGGCEKRLALPRLRSVTSNLRASSGFFRPERVCFLQTYLGAAQHLVVLVTKRRFPPPLSVEERTVSLD
jgi:hypothetical protein